MRTTHRSYSDDSGDFARLCRLVSAGRGEQWRTSTWCLGRVVDWKYSLFGRRLEQPGFLGRNAELWLDGFGDLAGLAISEGGGADLAVITAPGYRLLFPELVDWALAAWADRGPRMAIELTEAQEFEAMALDECGFVAAGSYATRRFDLAAWRPRPAPLAPGFSIVDMRSHPDYRGRRALRLDAFDGRAEPSEDELRQWLQLDRYGLSSPIYHAETDLCVRAPDGRLVAGCEALIDARTQEADIERVCTRGAFRGRGLARAVILACLERLRAIGIRRAYITGYSDAAIGLYSSLGHDEELRCGIYERPAPPLAG